MLVFQGRVYPIVCIFADDLADNVTVRMENGRLASIWMSNCELVCPD